MDYDKLYNKEEIAFEGIIRANNLQCPGIVTVSFFKHRPNNIHVEITFFDKDIKTATTICFNQRFEVEGKNHRQKIRLIKVRSKSLDSNKLIAEAERLIIGELESKIVADRIDCWVRIKLPYIKVANNFSASEKKYRYAFSKEFNEGITWESSIGKCALEDCFEVDSLNLGMKRGSLKTYNSEIKIYSQVKCALDVDELLESAEKESEKWLRLISLLSRRHISFYAIEVHIFYNTSIADVDNIYRVNVWRGIKNTDQILSHYEEEPIIDNHMITEKNLFQEFVNKYDDDKIGEIIEKAIIYTVSSYEQDMDLHSQFLFAHTALEILVHSLSEDKRNGFFKKKLIELTKKYDIPVDDLFFWNVFKPEDGFKAMIERRNLLIHQGKVEDYQDMFSDIKRLRILNERFILILLGCSLDSLNKQAYEKELMYLRTGRYY